MRKIYSILLVFLLCFFTACSSSSQTSSDNTKANTEEATTVNETKLTESEIKQMYSNPDDFKGRKIELLGKVLSNAEYDEDAVYFQMYGDIKNSSNNTVVGFANPDFKVEEGNYVKVIGTVKDKFEGENALGGKITAPTILADSVEVLSYQEAVAPTTKEIIPENNSIDQLGYKVTINKIELSEPETRVYLTVENNGSGKFSLYDFNSILIQDGKQYENQDNWAADYPEIQTDLRVGVSTEGIITFPKINESNFQLIFDGSPDDWNEKIEDYQFDITVN